jgi:hypothetical protein
MTDKDGGDIYFEIVGSVKPSVEGQNKYQRILIKKVEYMDILNCNEELLAILEVIDPEETKVPLLSKPRQRGERDIQ